MENISKAIISVMTEINGVAKSMTVGTGSNSYKGVSDKDVKILMREAMLKQGLSILPIAVTPTIKVDRWDETNQYGTKSKQSIFTEVTTRYLLLHTSGESIELAGYGHGVDTQDKGAGKATTYALKNTLLNMFLVPTGVDTDDTHSDEYEIPGTTKPLDMDEYLLLISKEDNVDTLRVLYMQALQSEQFSEAQMELLKSSCEKQKEKLENPAKSNNLPPLK